MSLSKEIYEYMHMALVGVRYGFISALVSESSPSLKYANSILSYSIGLLGEYVPD